MSTRDARSDLVDDDLAIAVIKGLAMDAPHRAESGHQGTAMALAPLAHVLWSRILTYDAEDPAWPDRDRLVLSAGHASILLYSMLYLTGHGLELDDLKDFRQWDSATPGHPEAGHTPGVEVTTGPLGQGVANAVGMAIAERSLRARFGPEVCDHHVFTICGDGDLSEGISHEAASLAGHLKLGRLVQIYDDNHITIDGPTELALDDDAPARFAAYGWSVEDLGEAADDLDELEAALRRAMADEDAPSLIVVRSHIASPAPNATDTPAAHGYSLLDDEIAATKEILGLPADQSFWVPPELLANYRAVGARGRSARLDWGRRRDELASELREDYDACLAGTGTAGWAAKLPVWEPGESVATRKASNNCIAAIADVVPGLMGGGADLTGNTGTTFADLGVFGADEPAGRQIYFGVREHAMAAIMNGAAHHGGVLPVGGTFLVFSDYCRGALRLSALSSAKVVFAFTHDSVGVGEDGPTHQPVEHLAALRAIPDLRVFRPADANEVAAAWRLAVDGDGPVVLALTRQNVPVLDGTAGGSGVDRGAYVLRDTAGTPDIVLLGTGSEVSVCVEASEQLAADGIAARVVSMPCWELFEDAGPAYQSEVLPRGVPTLAVEAAATFGWHRWADDIVGIDRFGASAPGDEVLDRLGINPTNVAARARALLTD